MTHTKRKPAFALVGVLPDGREAVLDSGTQAEVLRAYGFLHNCPVYKLVEVRELVPQQRREAHR
jgi:hypothetical protein